MLWEDREVFLESQNENKERMTTVHSVYSSDALKPGSLPPIRFPGPFTTCQGLWGDGIVNTIHDEPSGLASAIERRGGGSLAVSDVKQASRSVQEVFDRWRRSNRQRVSENWKEWAQHAARMPRPPGHNHDLYQVLVHEDGGHKWWIDEKTGYLASFEHIPDLEKPRFEPNGWIAPGTAVWGEELYSVLNPTIEPDCDASINLNETKMVLPSLNQWNNRYRLFPWNRGTNKAGEILMMRYRISPSEEYGGPEQEGYCVYSIDGYPLLYPGPLDKYADNFADPDTWYWKVVNPGGIRINQVLVPYGSLVQVEERFRNHETWTYQVVAHVWNELPPRGYIQVEGPLVVPLRSKAILPLPLAAPILYKTVIPGGARISTTEIEPRTTEENQRFHAREYGLLTITKRVLCDRRVSCQSKERLYVAGCGWISAKRRKGYWKGHEIVEPIVIDQNFNPRHPEAFHYDYVRKYLLQEHSENMPPSDGDAWASRTNYSNPSDIAEGSNESSAGWSSSQDVYSEVPSDEASSQDDASKPAGSAPEGPVFTANMDVSRAENYFM